VTTSLVLSSPVRKQVTVGAAKPPRK